MDFGFAKNQSYVVYAYEWQGQLNTSICSRTREFNRAVDDLNYLQPIPDLPLTPVSAFSFSPTLACVVPITVLALFGLGIIWALRQKVKKNII